MPKQKKLVFKIVKTAIALLLTGIAYQKLAGRGQAGDVLMQIELRTTVENDFLVIANGRLQGKALPAGSQFQKINSPMPRQRIAELKLVLGRKPAEITIRRVRLKSFSRVRDFKNSQLKRIFSLRTNIDRCELGADGLELGSRGNEAFLLFSGEFLSLVNALQQDRFLYALEAIFLGLLAWVLLLACDLRHQPLRLLRTRSFTPLVTLFYLVLLLPLADTALRFSAPWTLDEKRQLAPLPQFRFDTFWAYPRAFQNYYADHFGTRGLLVQLFANYRFHILKISPHPAVVIGKSGWFYLAQEGKVRNVMDYYCGKNPFSRKELDHWLEILTQRRDWLRRRGILYLMVFVPDKTTIYPEYLPAHIRRKGGKTRLDQLMDDLRSRPDIRVLDLRPIIREAKKKYRLYFRNDTHWNDYAGYIAYREILKRLNPNFPELLAIPLSQFVEKPYSHVGDLTLMLAMAEQLKEKGVYLRPAFPIHFKELAMPAPPTPWIMWGVTEIPGSSLPRAVMFRDSYGHWLMDFLSEHFSRIFYFWDRELHFDIDLILREKPDLVIEEMGERFLMGISPQNPDKIND